MKKLFKRMRKDQRGQTATEYMLIVAVLVTVVVGAASFFGKDVKSAIDGLSKKVTDTLNSAPSVKAGG
jgi:Flp pilus assembly pilin Flp